jgi:hypothetical protein
MNPQDILMYGHMTVLATVNSFPRERVYESGAVGYWSAKDVLAHLASYELVLIEVLQNALGPCPSPLREQLMADGQAFNDQQVDMLRKDRSFEQVLEEYKAAYSQTSDLARVVPADAWRQTGSLPWYGAEYDLEDFIVYTYYGHKREHCGQVQTFRDRFK